MLQDIMSLSLCVRILCEIKIHVIKFVHHFFIFYNGSMVLLCTLLSPKVTLFPRYISVFLACALL